MLTQRSYKKLKLFIKPLNNMFMFMIAFYFFKQYLHDYLVTEYCTHSAWRTIESTLPSPHHIWFVTHFNKLHLYLCHMHKQPGTHATRMLRYGVKSLAFRRQNNQFKLETNSTEQWKLSLSEVVSPIYVNCFFL